jgi:hypothetical protein
MRLLKAVAVTGLAATLTLLGQGAFAQTQSFSANQSNCGANSEGSWWNGHSRSTAWDLDRGVREDIGRASQQGEDVSDAAYFEQQGRLALQNGHTSRALANFRAAEECLGSSGTIGIVMIYPEATASGTQEQISAQGNQYQAGNFQENAGPQARAMRLRSKVVRDINQAISGGADVHEAATFENRGLQALENGDSQEAVKQFLAAEMALGPYSSMNRNFNTASNYQTDQEVSSESRSGSAWGQAWQLRRDIDQAQVQGYDVTDAQHFANRGRQALDNGNQNRAIRDFDKAEAALRESGFEGVQQASNSSGNNQASWNQAQQLRRDINQARAQGFDVTDAQHFVNQGRIALENGNPARAAREFAAARNLLPVSALNGNSNRSQQAYNQGY